jgi:hypothetical protein
VLLFGFLEAAEDAGDAGLAMHFHLVGQLAVAVGGVGLHCQRVGQQHAQAVDGLILPCFLRS